MIYRFIDNKGTFIVENPQRHNLYFPLTNKDGSLLSSISPNLAGDIKRDNDHFITPPAAMKDIRSNPLCRRDFFVKVDKETIRLSYPYRDYLEVGFLYHKIIKKTKGLCIEIVNFIPYNMAVEVMWIKITNKSGKEIKIIPTSFIPLYGRSEKNLRDHRHVSSLLNRIKVHKYGIFLRPTMVFDEKGHTLNSTTYFVLGFEDEGKPPIGQFPTLNYFYGDGDIIFPEAIEKDIKPVTEKLPQFDGKEACAAFRFGKRSLKKNEKIEYFLIMGMEENEQKIEDIYHNLNSPRKIDEALDRTKGYWQGYLSQLDFDFKDKNFNNWLLWVKLQPGLRKLFGCSFLPHFDYGKGGRGWRDLWQDALTLILSEPGKARNLILHNFKGVRIDGSNATIIAKEGGFISDRNRINRVWMDHGIWPYLTLRSYINKSGNINILLKDITYFRDHQLKRAKEIDPNFSGQDYLSHTKDNKVYQGNILEHVLVQNLVQFFNVGQHNIIRLENADWNDALDMAPDKGESVAFSFMYAHNIADICEILKKLKEKRKKIRILKELTLLLDRLNSPVDYNHFREKQKRLELYFEKIKNINGHRININIDDIIYDLKEKANHLSSWLRQKEWLKEGFFNGYYDNKGRRVEGIFKGTVRMMLPSQTFAIMSGVATDEQIKQIWASVNRYLKDKKLGGFHLNTNFNCLYLDLGRLFGFSYGDKENGAFFNHMVVMFANALYSRGFINEGFKAINSIYKMATSDEAKIYPMIPEYFNAEGKGLYLYLTGSASWYVHTLMEEILSIKFILGDIYFKPQLLDANFFNHNIQVKFRSERKLIKMLFIAQGQSSVGYKIKEIFLHGKKIPKQDHKYIIKKEYLNKKENTITVYLGDGTK